MLPMINVNPQNNDGDIKKQLSSLRTQMSTLRDAIEADLSNIRYDNLSPDLQKRIDEIDKTATSSSETISMVAQSLAVNYATIKELSAATARIGTIEANYITSSEVYTNFLETKDLSAEVATLGYATVGQLNAVDGKFTNLNASNIKAGTLSAARLDIDTLVGDSLKSKTVYCGGIVASGTVTLLGRRCYWDGGKLCTNDD